MVIFFTVAGILLLWYLDRRQLLRDRQWLQQYRDQIWTAPDILPEFIQMRKEAGLDACKTTGEGGCFECF